MFRLILFERLYDFLDDWHLVDEVHFWSEKAKVWWAIKG